MAKSSAVPKKKAPGTVAKRRSNKSKPSQQELRLMIERAAYFKAEQRNFEPGFEEIDWYEAENEIINQMGKR